MLNKLLQHESSIEIGASEPDGNHATDRKDAAIAPIVPPNACINMFYSALLTGYNPVV